MLDGVQSHSNRAVPDLMKMDLKFLTIQLLLQMDSVFPGSRSDSCIFLCPDIVTRQNFEGATATDKPFYPEERISLDTALAAYTIGSAYANFWDRETGSLEVGKSADLIVLSSNLFEVPPHQINQTNVLWTIFEGKIVYKR